MGWDACPWDDDDDDDDDDNDCHDDNDYDDNDDDADADDDDDDDDISSLPLARVVIPHGEGLVYISVCAPLNCLSTHEKNEGAWKRERERVLKASKDDNHPWDSWLLIIALLIEISIPWQLDTLHSHLDQDEYIRSRCGGWTLCSQLTLLTILLLVEPPSGSDRTWYAYYCILRLVSAWSKDNNDESCYVKFRSGESRSHGDTSPRRFAIGFV